jgi:hypothetical protein
MDKKNIIMELLKDFYPFAKNELGFNKPVRVFLTKDIQNAQDPMGKTAFYDPENMEVKLFYVDRHPKDILRSFAHELMHHKQNCDGRLSANIGESPVDENESLAKLEEEANMAGFLVRKWEDKRKKMKDAYLTYGQAKEEGEYMQESKKSKQKSKKKTKLKKKKNPWAICTAQVGREDKKKYEKCVLSVKEKYGIKKENLKESKMTKNSDFDKDLSDLQEKDTVKDHYSRRAERVFEKLAEKWKINKPKEKKDD